MGGKAMVKCVVAHGMKNGGCGCRNVAVDQHRNVLEAGGEYGSGHRGNFAPAEAAQHLQRIAQIRTMQLDSTVHGIGLAANALRINAGAGANPLPGFTAEQGVGDGRGNRGVADTHFADAEKITAIGDGLHAIGHGCGALGLVQRRILGDIPRRVIQCEFEHLQPKIVSLANLIDRGTAGLEVRHHLSGHLLRIGGHPLGHDTMIAGKHSHNRALDARRIVVLPAGHPLGDCLKPAQRTGRLGEPGVARPALARRIPIGTGKVLHKVAYVVEGQCGRGDCHLAGRLLFTAHSSQDSGWARNMSDDFESPGEISRQFRPFAGFLVSLRFLTRLPVPFVRRLDPPPIHAAMSMFPVAGALIGAITGLSLVLCKIAGLPEFFAAAVALATSALITGALHEDGLSDVADGFGGGQSREHRLDIMRDSRIGAYGALTLCTVTLGRASLYVALVDLPPAATIILLASAAAFSRALMVDLMWATRPARPDGLSVSAGRPSRNTTLLALSIGGIGAGAGASYVLAPAAAVIALIAGGVAVAILRALAMRKIGGQTGDVIGAGQVVAEIAMLAVYAATLSLP